MNPYMEEAIREARQGIEGGEGGPFGSVIVRDGRVVGRGHNQVVKRLDPTCHGEIMAIRDACAALHTFDLSGCELYTTGEPCPMCLGAILWANIARVYFGCDTADTERIGFRDRQFYALTEADKAKWIRQLDHDACLDLYRAYLARQGNTPY